MYLLQILLENLYKYPLIALLVSPVHPYIFYNLNINVNINKPTSFHIHYRQIINTNFNFNFSSLSQYHKFKGKKKQKISKVDNKKFKLWSNTQVWCEKPRNGVINQYNNHPCHYQDVYSTASPKELNIQWNIGLMSLNTRTI